MINPTTNPHIVAIVDLIFQLPTIKSGKRAEIVKETNQSKIVAKPPTNKNLKNSNNKSLCFVKKF